MNIGEKIRSLRVAKLMTQSELVGNHITRNMLSCIENGTAQPSLSTIEYIAKRLNVPVGFLLAEEGDEIVYQKMNNLSNIKRAYRAGDLSGCRSLCLLSCPEPDDEIRLLLANCDLGMAEDAFWKGKLRYACRLLDEALQYAAETLYPMPHIRARAEVCFRYMCRLSPTLYSDILDEGEQGDCLLHTPFAHYVDALEGLDEGNTATAEAFFSVFPEETGFFSVHLQIRLYMEQGKYAQAKADLLGLLASEEPLNEISLYSVLSDLEICCRETDDYKGAYHYSNERVAILEQLLKDN